MNTLMDLKNQQMVTSSILQRAEEVQAKKNKVDVLDVRKRFSYGKDTQTTNLVDERVKAIQVNLKITNLTGTLQTVAFGAISASFNPTQFPNEAAALTAVSATGLLKNGVIVDEGPGKTLTASLTDSGLSLDAFIKYISNNPTRITGLSMVSRNATTFAGDSTNYDLKMRTYWVSPFDVPVKKELNLRPLVVTGANFTQERLNVDFIKHAFPLILSPEHFWTLQIASNTELMITVYVGAQDSRSQLFWRDIKAADDVLRPTVVESCNC